MFMNKNISIVVPAFNEEKVLTQFYNELKKVLTEIKLKYEIIFIDDGSVDNTLLILKGLKTDDSNIKIVSFSRNFGKEAAIYAGLKEVSRRYYCYYGFRFAT